MSGSDVGRYARISALDIAGSLTLFRLTLFVDGDRVETWPVRRPGDIARCLALHGCRQSGPEVPDGADSETFTVELIADPVERAQAIARARTSTYVQSERYMADMLNGAFDEMRELRAAEDATMIVHISPDGTAEIVGEERSAGRLRAFLARLTRR